MHIKEVENNQFYQFPQWLLKEPYNQLSFKAMVMYMLLWDRRELSVKNKWYDNDGKVYLYFTNEQFKEKMGISEPAVISGKKELLKLGLISEVRQGVNKPNRLYINGTKEVLGQELKEFKHGTKEVLGQELKEFKGIKTEYIKTNISRLSNQEELEETSYLDIEQTPPPPPKKSMDFGQFVKRSGLEVGQDHVSRLLEYIGIDGMEMDLLKLAITKTVDQGIKAPKYTFRILDNWKAKGITTLEQGLKEQEEFEASKTKKKTSHIDEDEAKRMQEKYGF